MIRRKTPLRRSAKPLARSPLRRVSKKHGKELREYSKLRKTFLEEHTTCEVSRPECSGSSSQVHHVFKRGKYLNVPSTWLACCDSCHRWVHGNPSQARTLNLLK